MTLPPGYFADLYARSSDPWGFADRWYEERKRAVTLAALPRARYVSAFEPGCSFGLLTEQLARRCDRLLAADVVPDVVAAAARRCADHPGVRVEERRVPQDWPAGPFDLVVLSEVGYYVDSTGLRDLVGAAVGSLRPGGHLVAVHWRHPVSDYPVRGDAVHAALAGDAGLARTVRHVEEDFLLEVFARIPPGPRSVAAESGLR